MSRPTKSNIEFARRLRSDPTDAERRLWHYLRDRRFCGLKFRRQHPVGKYIADFACPERGLIIELDGGQHATQRERDARRGRELEKHGYRVLRFWDNDVLVRTQVVLEAIYAELFSSPQPSPHRGEGEEGSASHLSTPSPGWKEGEEQRNDLPFRLPSASNGRRKCEGDS